MYSPATERAIRSAQTALRKWFHTRAEVITWLILAADDYSQLAAMHRAGCTYAGTAFRTSELLAAIRDITRE